MLTFVAMGKSMFFPVLLAGVLVLRRRRSANGWLLLAAFLAGGLGAFSLNTSILRQLPSMVPPGQVSATAAKEAWLSGFVEAALPEEFAKGVWMLVFLVGWRRYAAGHGTLLGGLVGLGFALRENLAYAQTLPEWRVMGAFAHGAWGVIMGSLLQHALDLPVGRGRALFLAFLPTVLLHGLADVSIFLVEVYEAATGLSPSQADSPAAASPVLLFNMALTVAVDVFSIAWAVRILRAGRRQSVAAEISA